VPFGILRHTGGFTDRVTRNHQSKNILGDLKLRRGLLELRLLGERRLLFRTRSASASSWRWLSLTAGTLSLSVGDNAQEERDENRESAFHDDFLLMQSLFGPAGRRSRESIQAICAENSYEILIVFALTGSLSIDEMTWLDRAR
jgi:hypothetical protein